MNEPMQRPAGTWDDATWNLLRRITDADPAWVKPAWAPELFGLTPQGVRLAAYLLDQGCLPTVSPADDEDEGMRLPVHTPGREVVATFGAQPKLIETAILLADEPKTWRALALADHEGFDVITQAQDGEIEVSVAIRFEEAGGDPLQLVGEIGREFADHVLEMSARADGGYADMVTSFVNHGLALPYIPGPLRDGIQQRGEWSWSTFAVPDADRLSDDVDLVAGAVADRFTAARRGLTVSLFPLRLTMVTGPLAVVVDAGWVVGGGQSDSAGAAEIAHVADLVRRAERRLMREEHPPTGEWVRPVLVVCSDSDDLCCRIWDPVRGERVDVPLSTVDPWSQIEGLIDECWIPQVPR